LDIWIIIIFVLFIHFIADFVCQSNRVALGKSKDLMILVEHIWIYGFVFTVGLLVLIGNGLVVRDIEGFIMFTMLAHFATDIWTSKINAWLWEKKEVHWFFVSIGFDQFLHAVALLWAVKLFFFKLT